ncbi:putative molybdenum cofactor guanylyltransferase [Candidatus Desulfosporosinus infrequens]|uniref:Putative molybdenum cofactor guanylyltransferase n=1 Tax=Candidatus Desulfosporosinus infrequens TaxID=2043169 RepID=A0A2U3L7U5_9FIRM|nr:putative molybdenum cofactor guanylyltransferase [Candidatus Desulfosporosinus infrequens]
MKKNKAFLELEGQPLVERSLNVLHAVFAEVLISSNNPELYDKYDVPIIQDESLNRGPLEGLYQGLKAATYDEVFFVACDMPFLEANLIRLLAKWAPEYDIVVPRLQSGTHPLHAFYNRRCLPAIKRSIETGRLKVGDLCQTCSVKYVEETELQAFGDLSRVFCNVNTPNEWSAIVKG